MKKLGRKKKKNIDSVIEWRINKHLNKVDKRRSMSDVRSPWLSAGSASPELRHNQGELRQLAEAALSRMQNLPMNSNDGPFLKGLNMTESELKQFRELNPGSGVDRMCEKMDNKARQKVGLPPKPTTKIFSIREFEILIERRKDFLASKGIELKPDDYCKLATRSGFMAMRMIQEEQELVTDFDVAAVATVQALVTKLISEFDNNAVCRICQEVHADTRQQRTPRRGDVAPGLGAVGGSHYSGAVAACSNCGKVECVAWISVISTYEDVIGIR